MKTMHEFLKNTIAGGLLFLLPLGLVVLVLKQVMSIATAFATPIVARLPVRDFAGVTMVTLVSVLLLLLVALLPACWRGPDSVVASAPGSRNPSSVAYRSTAW